MEEKNQNYKKPLNMASMSARVGRREDCIYKNETIRDILRMYFEECEKAFINGEKVGLSNIGVLQPKVHAVLYYNLPEMNDEEGNKPYTTLKFRRSEKNKMKMNSIYLQNIKNGFAGLGEECRCSKAQETILTNKGFLKSEKEEEN